MKEMGWDDQMRVFKQLTNFTYFLKTEREDRIGWSDERCSNKITKFTYCLETEEGGGIR